MGVPLCSTLTGTSETVDRHHALIHSLNHPMLLGNEDEGGGGGLKGMEARFVPGF